MDEPQDISYRSPETTFVLSLDLVLLFPDFTVVLFYAFTDYLKQVLIICLMIVWLDEASFPVTEKHYGQKEVPVQYFYTEQTEV